MQESLLASREIQGSAALRAAFEITRQFQESSGLRVTAELGKQMQARQERWAEQATSISRMLGQFQESSGPWVIAEAALEAHWLFPTAQLVEHVAEAALVGSPGLAPLRQLSDAERLALQRAAIFIAVGILVILAMELAPEATAQFGVWLGITGGLATLLWALTESAGPPRGQGKA